MLETENFRKSLEYKNDDELNDLFFRRATGNSTRKVDKIVQEFFQLPMGTEIPVYDHYPTRQADEFLFRRVAERLEREHHVKFHKGQVRGGLCIVRDEPTLQEVVAEEIKRRKGLEVKKMNPVDKYRIKHL